MIDNDALLEVQDVNTIIKDLLETGSEEINEGIQQDIILNNIRVLAVKVVEIEDNKGITIQEAYQRVFDLIDTIDRVLGNLPRILAYVTDTGNIYLAPLNEMSQHINNEYRIAGIGNNGRKLLEKELQKSFGEQHVKIVKAAFHGTQARLERHFSIYKKYYSTKQNGYLLYKTASNKWQGQRILNYGDVKEAYFAAMIDDDYVKKMALDSKPIGRSPYQSHELISYFAQKYIGSVSNKSALLEEDVMSETLQAQFAVKGSGASAPLLKQYINFAEKISNTKFNEELEQIIRQYMILNQDANKGLRNLVLEESRKTKKEMELFIEENVLNKK